MIAAARHKLELLGLSDRQINNLVERKAVSNTVSVHSPYNGYLITRQQASSESVETTESMPDKMGNSSSGKSGTDQASGDLLIREGNYTSAGQTLFSVVDTDAVRIEFDLPATESATISKGDKMELDLGNGSKEQAVVDLVQPFYNDGQQTLKLRVNLRKKSDLHIGQLVKATIDLPSRESLWLPETSVVDLGAEKIVFIKERNVLKPRKITAGHTTNGMINITSGLASSDEVAADAQYLIDSESFVKIN
jgi:multidrug efflux pump subunit AcrA (membrane-fusion protein)